MRLALDNYLENKTNILNDLMDKPYKEAEKQLYDAIEKTRKGFNSQWGNFVSEGIVLRPEIELKTRNNQRIITKIKHKDFKH